MEKEKILEELGLSKNESKVYLALLEIGKTTAGKVTERSKIHRTSVYDALERLIKKGLVSFIIEGDTRYFEATDPKNLMNIIEDKKRLLTSCLPQLELAKELTKDKGDIYIYEGVRALRDVLNLFLEIKEPRYVYGVPNNASDVLGRGFMKEYHEKRVKLGLPMKHIYNSDAKERTKWLNSLNLTESKHLLPEFDSPVATSICGDMVVLTLYSNNPINICIKNKDIAKAYKGYFDILWNLAKK